MTPPSAAHICVGCHVRSGEVGNGSTAIRRNICRRDSIRTVRWLCGQRPPVSPCESAASLWPPIAILMYGLVLILTLLSFVFVPTLSKGYLKPGLIVGIGKVFGIGKAFDKFMNSVIALGLPVYSLLLFIFLSGQFLRHWALQFGGFSAGGDYLAWTLYTASWLLDNGLGNFGQIFSWDISSIHPTNDTARSLVWIYNLVLEFLAVAAVVKVFVMFMDQRRVAQPQDAGPPPRTTRQRARSLRHEA